MTMRSLNPPRTHWAAFFAAFSVISSELLFLRILSGIRIGFTLASFFIYAGAILGLGLGNFIWVYRRDKPNHLLFTIISYLPVFVFGMVIVLVPFSLFVLQFISRDNFFEYLMICMYLLYPFVVVVYLFFGYAIAHILNCASRGESLLKTWGFDIIGSAVGGALPILLVAAADPLVLIFLPFLGSLILVLLIVDFSAMPLVRKLILFSVMAATLIIYLPLMNKIRTFDLLRSAYPREFESVIDRWKDTTRAFLVGDYQMGYIGWSPYRKLNFVEADSCMVIMYDNLGTTALMTNNKPLRDAPAFYYPTDLSRVLIIGAGAGGQIPMFSENADSIIAVELDPTLVRFAKSFPEKTPYLHAHNTHYHSYEGLSYLLSNPGPYSTIIYPHTDSFIAASLQSYVKAENYLYTVEGLRTAIRSLKEDGVLVIALIENMNEFGDRHTMRSYPTVAVHLFRNLQEIDTDRRNSIIVCESGEVTRRVVFIYQKGGINKERLLNLLHDTSRETILTDSSDFRKFASAAELTTQDRPFFYIAGRSPPPPVWEAAFYLLLTSLGAIILVVYRAQIGGAFKGLDRSFYKKQFIYTACTGFGFMTVVTVLIQCIVPLFGAPYLAGTVVITSILLGAGVTSFAMNLRKTGSTFMIALLSTGLIVIVLILLPGLTARLSDIIATKTLLGRIMICCLCFFPLGMLMGVPFPAILSLARTRGSSHVVLAYAGDVSFSILGIVVSLILPILVGYSVMFYTAAVGYAVITLILISIKSTDVSTI